MNEFSSPLHFSRHRTSWLLIKLLTLCLSLTARAQDTNSMAISPECQSSASYFAEFYAGLQTMHSHGLTSFVPGSADAQAYFIQVQKNGEKVEMNVVKSLRGDGSLKPQVKANLIKLNQSVAQSMRYLAETDARDKLLRDKDEVKNQLLNACQASQN
jgi:hypothetical protein